VIDRDGAHRSARPTFCFPFRRKAPSVRLRLCLDDVRIEACVAVEGSDSVVVRRIGSQAGYILTGHIAHVAILIAENVSAEGVARGDV